MQEEGQPRPAKLRTALVVASSPIAIAWLVGFNLRSVYLATPPVLPAVRQDLGLSLGLAGFISALPAVCLGLGAIPGAMLANRYGVRRVIGVALAILALAACVRALTPQPFWLLLGTFGLASSIALIQPALAAVMRTWFPHSVERASSLYTNGLSVGALLGASLTPFLLVLMGWRATFVFWALPAAAAALLWFRAAPVGGGREARPARLGLLARDPEVWRAAALFGTQNLIFTSAMTWIPFILSGSRAGNVAFALLLLNLVVLVPTVLFAAVRWGYATSRPLYVLSGMAALLGSIGLVVGVTAWVPVAAVLIGAGTGLVGISAFALPPVRARAPGDVAGYSALMLTAGYAVAFTGPWLGGLIADRTNSFAIALSPTIPAALAMLVLGATIQGSRRI